MTWSKRRKHFNFAAVVTDRRNDALEKYTKRVCDSQTAADIESEDQDEDGEGLDLQATG